LGSSGGMAFPPGGGGPLMPTGQLFMWLLIVGVTMLFAALSSAAIVRIGTDGRMFPLPSIVWANTAVLLASSITLGMVQWRVRRRRFAESVPTGLLWLTVALGGLFVAGQLSAWRELMAHGLGLARMPAVDFFYVLTAAHGLHLLGGLIALGALVAVRKRPLVFQRRLAPTALYWHFLTVVWIGLLVLLVTR
jgi:cytochrome c oxidase subunit 3